MGNTVKVGDSSDHGGVMVSASSSFSVNGASICVDQDMHVCPIPGHGTTQVSATSSVRNKGKKIIKVGDVAGCGATIVTSSSTLTVG